MFIKLSCITAYCEWKLFYKLGAAFSIRFILKYECTLIALQFLVHFHAPFRFAVGVLRNTELIYIIFALIYLQSHCTV